MNKFPLVVIFLILSTTGCATLTTQPATFSLHHQVGDTYMGIRLQGTLKLASQEVNGLKVMGLSDLAWDEDEKILYAISDKGNLFHLHPVITNHVLTDVKVSAAYPLTKGEKALNAADAEGLTLANGNNGIAGDSQLIISLESTPRIMRFTPTGEWLSNETLPPILRDVNNYAGTNKQLEAVTLHSYLGILTAPEWPLKQKDKEYSLKGEHEHTLYTLNGKQWSFPAYPAPNSAIVALEALEDNSILVLERAYVSKLQPIIISLRQAWVSTCSKCQGGVETKPIVAFNSHEGWLIDNFEGLTHHEGAYFFMVSDDNDSSLQRTLLNYFEILGNAQVSAKLGNDV
jgi:hypothetical protein